MKLRIKDNSIRLRLTRSEVQQMYDTGRVSAFTQLTTSKRLGYELVALANLPHLTAVFENDTLQISVPETLVKTWASSETQVGFEATCQADPQTPPLAILVEKDFKCLNADRAEDESDNYEHPNPAAQNC
ncbi:MAG TPA: hypothetical protein DCM08_14095 [Microscillaceae bacterium]|jgi:hypothetical protein|nr:hypothetical protein [Microscillaceae bacterium]